MNNIPKNKALEIIKKYNPDYNIPFPFDRVIKGEDMLEGIYYLDFFEINKNKNEHISGLIFYDKNIKKAKIYINKHDHKTRQYFTIAHELGHFFLHVKELKKQEIISDNEKNMWFRALSDSKEAEANRFAAELIMPEEKVREMYEVFGNDVDELANFFQVSKVAMAIRLEALNLDK